MKITINKQAEKVLKKVKKNMCCSDSTAIIILYETLKREMRMRNRGR